MNLKANLFMFVRFIMTGISNFSVDIVVMNLLLFLFWSEDPVILTFYSLAGAVAATVNSFILNKKWTFKSKDNTNSAKIRFFLVSAFGILVSTSMFFFTIRQLMIYTDLSGYLLVNISKVISVVVSAIITFMGYQIIVFTPERIKVFRQTFTFDQGSLSVKKDLLWLTAIAALVRLLFLATNTFVYGDAVNYAMVAEGIALGNYSGIDTFWVNLYPWWESLFYFLPISSKSATILSCLIPGVLLVIPVFLIANKLFGWKSAWLAALFTAVHPRLVAFSINGYAEAFSLCLLASAAACLIYRSGYAGIFLGAYIAVRNEGILLLPLFLFVIRSDLKRTFLLFSTTALFLTFYAAVNLIALDNPGLLQKMTNLGKVYSEQLDPVQSAKEIYSQTTTPALTFEGRIKRILRNEKYVFERLPGVLLSPVFIFALLLPFLIRTSWSPGQTVLTIIFLYPLIVYPLIQVEPRLLFPILIPIHIWGAAGIIAFTYCFSIPWKNGLAAICIALLLVVTVWRGVDLGKKEQLYQNLAIWIKENIPHEQTITGNGYGYISNTSFLVPNPYRTAPWVNEVSKIVTKDAKWLILYEEFIKTYNPQLLPALKNGVPGATKEYETADGYGKRAQIYRINKPHLEKF